MAEENLKPFVMVITFISLFSMVIGFLIASPVLLAGETINPGSMTHPSKFASLVGMQYIVWEPGSGYIITSANITDHWYDDDKELRFWQEGHSADWNERVRVWIIRDYKNYAPNDPYQFEAGSQYKDFIGLYRKTGWWTGHRDFVPFEEILTKHDPQSNTTTISVKLNEGFELFIHNDTDMPLPEALRSNSGYEIGLGRTLYNETAAANSALSIIGNILTFDMPGVHPIVNAMIAIPIWACVAYLVMVIALKFIPFLG